jgi:hypothetical protein
VTYSQVVNYEVDDNTVVAFEIEPIEGYVPAGVEDVAGHVRAAIAPAVTAARVALDQVRKLAPDGVQIKFGIKVTGTTSWIIAKAATEANFEVTLTWQPPPASPG